ncbi:MAG: trypsin-like serine protease [Bacteroides sp.]|jgi:uncharacterized membrane protein|nr:trypsin-like serine protease [Bacteroides sp.]
MHSKFTFKALSRLGLLLMLMIPMLGVAQINPPHQGQEMGFSLKESSADKDQVVQEPTLESFQRFLEFHDLQDRIVGGDPVEIRDYPWQVSLQLQPQYGGDHFCGGTIINGEWILTAAHCLVWDDVDFQPGFMRVRAGFTGLSSNEGSYYNVVEFVLHPDYNDDTHQNDIALVRLSSPIDLTNPLTKAVKIVTQSDAAAGLTDPDVIGLVSGWGTLYSDGPSPDTLQAAAIPIVDPSQSSYPPSMITADMLMAGEPGLDACQGDSGGPFVVPDGFGGYKIAGIVSWGIGCGLPGYPGLYARVSHFEEWIGQYVVVSDPNQFTNLWFEGFEPPMQNGAMPDGWTLKRNTAADGGLNGNNLVDPTANIPLKWFRLSSLNYPYSSGNAGQYIHSGEASMHINWNATDFNWAITPEITLPSEGNNLEFSFWLWSNSDIPQGWITKLYVNIFVNGQWETIASLDDGASNLFASSVDIALDDYLGETVKFAFIHEWNDGIQLSIDDVSIRYENPAATAIFRVTDGENPLSDSNVDVTGVGTFITDVDGTVPVNVFIGPHAYQFSVTRQGYFPFSGSVEITADNQLVEIVLEKIPAPEIEVSPQSIVMEVFQGQTVSQGLTISNTGDAELNFNLFSVPAVKKASPAIHAEGPVMYDDIKAEGVFSAAIVPADLSAGLTQDDRQFEQVEIHYDSGPGGNAIGTGGAATWISAVRFTPEELALYYGMYELSAIKFHINGQTFSSVTAKIWKGGNDMGPSEEIYSADVTSDIIPNSFTTHELPENLPLESGYEYWIGYQIQATSGYPSTVDAGPMVEGKGAWMYLNNTWAELTDINASLDYNWVIRGILDPILGVDWLSFDPESGNVLPGEDATPMVIADATNLELGEYQANIVVRSNASDDVLVPVNLTVVPPAFLVAFDVVDTNGDPITDAVISLAGQTNASGDYTFPNQQAGTLAYAVEKEGFLTASGSVMVVDQNILLAVTLIPDDATTYALDVLVNDEFDTPVEGAYFTLESVGSFFTNELGQIGLTVVPGEYNFSVSKEGMLAQSGTVTIVDDNMALGISLNYMRYLVEVVADPETGGAVIGGGEYYHGQSVTVSAQAAEYHSFLSWTENGEVVAETTDYTFEVIGPRSLVAHFEIFTYDIIVSADPEEGGTVAGSGTYEHGTAVSVLAQPATNYQFLHWTENDVVIEGAEESYSFPAESDRNLVAVFAMIQHTLTIVKEGEGITDPDEGEHPYPHGTQVTLTATNNGMWEFVKWSVGPQTIPGNPITITISNDVTLTATFQDVTSVIETGALDEMIVYPNPASGKVFIKLNQQISNGLLRVIDASGSVVWSMELQGMVPSQILQLDATHWNRGIYFVSLTGENGVQTLPLVISR